MEVPRRTAVKVPSGAGTTLELPAHPVAARQRTSTTIFTPMSASTSAGLSGLRMMRLTDIAMCLCLFVWSSIPVAFAAATDDGQDYARQLSALVNDYRKSQGRATLPIDETIAALAREHSLAMSKAGKLNHDGFESRVRRSGLAMCIENVGWNYALPKGQLDAWRASAGHDRNMLDPRVQRMGIGVASGYVTMIACAK